MNRVSFTRRGALQSLLGIPAVHSLGAQTADEPGRIPPITDLVNVFEMLAVARQKLAAPVYATIAGTDRRALERITFRPRMMVNVTQLDLSVELLGERLHAPILVGPMSNLQAFHPEGEIATVRGASAARTLMVVSSRSSRKLREIVAEAKTPLWFGMYPDAGVDAMIASARDALQAGCKAICLTVGVPHESQVNQKMDWASIDRIRQNVKAPLILKGIMSPEEAQRAVSRGVDAVIVSNHGAIGATGFADPIEMLPSIAQATGSKIPILIDGSFRRGTDILKALSLGARAVLLGRPPVSGLAAYGAEGVQKVLQTLQTELARNMALCGKPDLKSVDRSLVKVHRR